ncbi:MAG: fumarate hydratase [Deltaproteobacteria bacterium RIFOXYA12_FULL_61_11]|nr:MAG: fumarate hydratase [Deltaproteobacteria bacterium RIFOXYA12_FULL_61_11]
MFQYEPMFQLGKDETPYRLLGTEHVKVTEHNGRRLLEVAPAGLSLLAKTALRDIAFLLRPTHLQGLSNILTDPEASDNDVFVAANLLENAIIAAEGVFPGCQDTGTAIVLGKKGQAVWTGGDDEEALSAGIYATYAEQNLRYSQVAPLTMYEEANTGTNLPAQIDLFAVPGDEYRFLFLAKGGGSANKTFLYQQTKALLNPASLRTFLEEKLRTLGTAACPPYHLAVVIGGTSAEMNLKTVKLASAHYLDHLPTSGNRQGRAFRDLECEAQVLDIACKSGIGAQFGGKYFAHDVRVIRLPRHGASCPVGLGVSCSADRNIKAKITADGIFLEQLETDPSKYLLEGFRQNKGQVVRIDLEAGMDAVRAELTKHPVKTRLMLNGDIIVARDTAHAKLDERLAAGKGLPDYFKQHVVYYAGPAKTPAGYASGSFGPTTAGRMDSYVQRFQAAGGSLVMLAKGNRSRVVTESCKQHGGFYLGSIGGAAAILAKQCITKQEVVEYPELGMEAIFKIRVKDFPAFLLVDDKGNDFFSGLL